MYEEAFAPFDICPRDGLERTVTQRHATLASRLRGEPPSQKGTPAAAASNATDLPRGMALLRGFLSIERQVCVCLKSGSVYLSMQKPWLLSLIIALYQCHFFRLPS